MVCHLESKKNGKPCWCQQEWTRLVKKRVLPVYYLNLAKNLDKLTYADKPSQPKRLFLRMVLARLEELAGLLGRSVAIKMSRPVLSTSRLTRGQKQPWLIYKRPRWKKIKPVLISCLNGIFKKSCVRNHFLTFPLSGTTKGQDRTRSLIWSVPI